MRTVKKVREKVERKYIKIERQSTEEKKEILS